jgi:hypothetical protein
MEQLEEEGYCVIPNVIPDFVKVRDRVWRDLMDLIPGFDPRAGAPREAKRHIYSLYPMHSMLYQHEVGHLQSVWNIRQRPEIKAVFAQIWDTEDLYVSFDGISVLVPPETTGRGFHRSSTSDWMHVDQSPHKTGRWSVQGFLNLYDATTMDATLAVIPGSHLEDRSGFVDKDKKDWLLIPGRLNEAVRVEANAGDLVLWDSRTVHQGTLPIQDRPTVARPIEGLMSGHEYSPRLVVYVCMLPKLRLTKAQRTKRIEAFANRRMTNHWGTKLFAKAPRRYGGPPPTIVELPAPNLNAIGKSLI